MTTIIGSTSGFEMNGHPQHPYFSSSSPPSTASILFLHHSSSLSLSTGFSLSHLNSFSLPLASHFTLFSFSSSLPPSLFLSFLFSHPFLRFCSPIETLTCSIPLWLSARIDHKLILILMHSPMETDIQRGVCTANIEYSLCLIESVEKFSLWSLSSHQHPLLILCCLSPHYFSSFFCLFTIHILSSSMSIPCGWLEVCLFAKREWK